MLMVLLMVLRSDDVYTDNDKCDGGVDGAEVKDDSE